MSCVAALVLMPAAAIHRCRCAGCPFPPHVARRAAADFIPFVESRCGQQQHCRAAFITEELITAGGGQAYRQK